MIDYETLTRPELFNRIPVVGRVLRDSLEQQGLELLSLPQPPTEKITVAIRTLNEAQQLCDLLDTIEQQFNADDTQVIVVDNKSSDFTAN